MTSHHRLKGGVALLGICLTYAASAGVVSVSVKTQAGQPAVDTVLIFDPLDGAPPPSHGPAVIDQIDKHFKPTVSVIRTGTTVDLPNSDSIRHEVYSVSPPHPFKIKLYASSHHEQVTFDKPGLLVLGCNIHDSMVAFVVVVDTPYFAKILPAATADFNLPVGHYRLRVWHPKLRNPVASREISVGSDPMALPLTVDLDPARETAPNLPD
jgi:plastocyanin